MLSVVTPAPSFATRPVISWPKIAPSGGIGIGRAPRQIYRAEPHMFAIETFIRIAPGSTSGIGNSWISYGWRNPLSTAALPFMLLLDLAGRRRFNHRMVASFGSLVRGFRCYQ